MKDESHAITRAMRASSVMGSLRVASHTVVALITYPLIIRDDGVAVLGVWVLLQLVIGYGNLTTLGMGTLITKAIADTGTAPVREALGGAVYILSLLSTLILIAGPSFAEVLSRDLTEPLSKSVLWFVALGVALRLWAALYAAVLAGHQRTHLVQLSESVQALSFFAAFLALRSHSPSLAALGPAYAAGYAIQLAFVTFMLARVDPPILTALPALRLASLIGLWRGVRQFLLMDITLLGREPLMRYAVYLCCGSKMMGVFELANRIPATVRQTFVLGLSALMPAVARLHTSGARIQLVAVATSTLRYAVIVAGGALLLYGINASWVFHVWVGEVDPQLIRLSAILTVWWMVTTLNVPAWWMGIGLGAARSNVLIVGTHFLATGLLAGVAALRRFDLLTLTIVWVLAGLAMQALLYVVLERKTGLIRPVYFSRSARRTGTAFVGLAGLSIVCALLLRRASVPAPLILVATTVLYALGAYSTISELVRFGRDEHDADAAAPRVPREEETGL